MNGTSSTDHLAYSFYLNLIVLDHVMPSHKDQDESTNKDENHQEAPTLTEDVSSPSPSTPLSADVEDTAHPLDDSVDDDDEGHSETIEKEEEPTQLHSSMLPTIVSPAGNKGKKADLLKKSLHGLDQSLRSNMRGWSKRSHQVANKAGAYAARKTMVSRAMQALNKCLPDLETINDVTIGKRFSQGKVTVLHVVLKPSAMPRYLAHVKDDDSATKYSSAMSTLESLGATETMKSLEREMLMQVRKGLMEKLSTMLPQTMKEKENGFLELDCIALEEAEEARWLFTFMEFQAQMKS